MTNSHQIMSSTEVVHAGLIVELIYGRINLSYWLKDGMTSGNIIQSDK
jgi:hypothetical protein